MKKSFLSALILSLGLWLASSQSAYAVPVRTYGSVSATAGFYSLRSENGGNGDLSPGSNVNVDSYLYQCKTRGTAACSTEHNSDATLVTKWQNSLTVPTLNNSTAQLRHDFSNLPYGQCGRVQYDQGVVGINGAIGGWVYDFGRDCNTTTSIFQSSSTNTCESQGQIDTQFRTSGSSAWVRGLDMETNTKVGQQIDVNCFAKSGSALLENGVIDLDPPTGSRVRVSNTAELRNYALNQPGRYTFTCSSTTINACTDTDNFAVSVGTSPTPVASPYPSPTPYMTPTPNVSPTPYPSPTPTPQTSSCNSLQVVGGNDSIVPAKVTLRASGSDSKGSIQGYRFYFGDGTRVDTTDAEVSHDYNVSGTFIARVDVKDSVGNYKSSSACETEVRVKSSSVESHKYGCSDVFVTADNGAKAPSLVHFTITGYDNKGNIQGYKLDFGNGIIKEGDSRNFEQVYDRKGTYPIRAYVKTSDGQWVGDTDSCHRSITIGSTTPLTHQPTTGTPTALPLFGVGSGAAGLVIEVARRRKLRV